MLYPTGPASPVVARSSENGQRVAKPRIPSDDELRATDSYMPPNAIAPPTTEEEWKAWKTACTYLRQNLFEPGDDPDFGGDAGLSENSKFPTVEATATGYEVHGEADFNVPSPGARFTNVAMLYWHVTEKRRRNGTFRVVSDHHAANDRALDIRFLTEPNPSPEDQAAWDKSQGIP